MMKRNTMQKKAVLETLALIKNHPTASMVYQVVNQNHPTISKSTVFRILASAAEDGEILRLHITGSDDRFDHQCQGHYHIRCRECGEVVDVEMPYIEDINDRITHSYGYRVEGHDIEFTGVCASCQKEGK